MSTIAVLGSGVVATAGSAAADAAIAGTYNVLPSTRIVNTISGVGASKAAVRAGATLSIRATGGLGTQSVSAVDLEVAVVGPTKSGFLTAYSGATRPASSTLNFTAGETTANDAAVKVDSTGTVKLYNGSAGTVEIVVDRQGYWTGGAVTDTGGAFVPSGPVRAVDSRRVSGSSLKPAATKDVVIPGLPANASAAVVNVAAVGPTASGYLTVTGAGSDQSPDSRTSSVSFTARRTRATLAYVPVTKAGTISLYNASAGTLDYIVDVLGYVTDGTPSAGGSEVVASPTRIADTRTNSTPAAAMSTRKVQVLPSDGPTTDVITAVIVSVSSVATPQRGYLTAWSGSSPRPGTSFSNFGSNVNRTSTVVVPIANDGSISIYNGATSPVNFAVDLQGLVVANFDTATPTRITKALAQIRATAARNLNR